MPSPSYLSGIFWSGSNACSLVLLPIAVFVFFARTLSPDLIGEVAVAISCIDILKPMTMSGFYEAVLRQDDDQRRCHETMLFVVLILACALAVAYLLVLAILGCFIASIASHYVAFAILSARLVVDAATQQSQARLAQQSAYRRLAVGTTTGITVGGAIGISIGLLANPLAGLVAYNVCQPLVYLLVLVIGSGAAAWPRLHRDCFHRMRKDAVLSTGVRLRGQPASAISIRSSLRR